MMKTKQVTKLLAVVALVASPVAADPGRAPSAPPANRVPGAVERHATPGAPAPRDPWAATAIVPNVTTAPAAPAAPLTLTALVELVSRPRTLPSGAPACGNVASRAPRPIDCGRSKP